MRTKSNGGTNEGTKTPKMAWNPYVKWYTRQDSNLQPSGSKPDILSS